MLHSRLVIFIYFLIARRFLLSLWTVADEQVRMS
jgi:hypothetical protein